MSTAQLGDYVADDNNNGAITIEIGPHQVLRAAGASGTSAKPQLAKLLLRVGFLTLLMDVATALYMPPRGVVFERHVVAYYLTLAGIFAAGVIEFSTGFCLSISGQANRRLGSFARAVLCASVGPLVTIIALGGFSVRMRV